MEKRDGRTILLDTNLLVLLVVGATSKGMIAKHKKARLFTSSDFDLLGAILHDHRVLILPHIAAEASNLVGFHSGLDKAKLTATFATIIGALHEDYVPSRQAAYQREHRYLGLTDAAILSADPAAEILTTDANLHIAALARGFISTNFNHLR